MATYPTLVDKMKSIGVDAQGYGSGYASAAGLINNGIRSFPNTYYSGTETTRKLDLSNDAPFTVVLWVKPIGLAGEVNIFYIYFYLVDDIYSNNAFLMSMAIYVADDGETFTGREITIKGGDFLQQYIEDANPPHESFLLGEWNMLCLAYDGASLQFYINNNLVVEKEGSTNVSGDNDQTWVISACPASSYTGGLIMDEAIIWDQYLDSDIRAALYNDRQGVVI